MVSRGWEEGEEGVTSNRPGFSGGDDDNVLELVVMVVQRYACTKHRGIVHCTGVILWDVKYTSVKKVNPTSRRSTNEEAVWT